MATNGPGRSTGIERFAVRKPFAEVFKTEIHALGTEAPRAFNAGQQPKASFATRSNGLALSGGGIRSAAVSLGVVQALAARDIFKHMDYLSTVSGGGYTGAALIAGLYRGDGVFPFSTSSGNDMEAADVADNDAVRAIRDHSRYLMPNGRFDLVVSLGILLRGLVVNAVNVACIVCLAASVALFAYPSEERLKSSLVLEGLAFLPREWLGTLKDWIGTQFVATKVLLCVLCAWLVAFAVYRSLVATLTRASEKLQSDPQSLPAALTAYAILAIAVIFVFEAQRPVIALALSFFGDEAAIQQTTTKAQYAFAALAAGTGVVGITFRFFLNLLQDAQKDASWSAVLKVVLARLVLYASASILPALIYGAYVWLVLLGLSSHGLYVRAPVLGASEYPSSPWPAIMPLLLVASLALLQAIVGPLADTLFCLTWWWRVSLRTWRFPVALAALGALALFAALIVRPLVVPALQAARVGSAAAWLYAACGAWLAFVAALFSENGNSLHRLYRDRIQEAFAIDPDGQPGQIAPNPLRLSALKTTKNGTTTLRPYPIVNATINLQASTRNRRGRNADFFVFTPHHVGYDRNYALTEDFEKAEPHLDLATAVAISGAAVSSAMGRSGIAVLAPTLTLLNIRLGFWLRNPVYAKTAEAREAAARGDWTVGYMLAETLNRLTDTMKKVYVTDGGHIDNLGLHQLLKRRCDVIIVSDAEADPAMTFGSYVDVERFARIDLGVRIDLPVEPLRVAALQRRAAIRRDPIVGGGSPPSAHAAIGTITYPATTGDAPLPEKEGIILYVKAAMTGDEQTYVCDYERRNPKFPHEPTSDQFFGEDQFEAYRALGFHAMTNALTLGDGSAREKELRQKLFATLGVQLPTGATAQGLQG